MPPAGRPHPGSAAVTIRATARGWRLSQHGTVLSEALAQPGPTHSVFDVLAAACALHPAPRHIALLGFGGGSVVAALRALGSRARIHAVDLDPTGWHLLRDAGCPWLQPLTWKAADALAWLERSSRRFDVILDDLSEPRDGDVHKPDATWSHLPEALVARLAPGGLAILNLLRPPRLSWTAALQRVSKPFRHAVRVDLDAFENRIVLASEAPLEARRVGRHLRETLQRLGSRQARALAVRGGGGGGGVGRDGSRD